MKVPWKPRLHFDFDIHENVCKPHWSLCWFIFFFTGWLLSWPLEETEMPCVAKNWSTSACELSDWLIIELTLWVVPPNPLKFNW